MEERLIPFTDEQQVLQVLQTTELMGKELTVYGTADEPLFVAKEIAKWIEHSDVSMMTKSLDEDEKGTRIVCTPGGHQEMTVLTEDGLYEVLMMSRKPIARQFKKGVKKILHEIRTTGRFAVQPKQMSELEILAKSAQALYEQSIRLDMVERRLDVLQQERDDNNRRLLEEERLSEEMPEKELNAKIRRLVNDYAEANNIGFDVVWKKVYRELEDRYHQRPKQCKREKSDKSILDIAVRKGYGKNLLVIASNLKSLFFKK